MVWPVIVDLGDRIADLRRREVRTEQQVARLTATEAALLACLARSPGQVLGRADLLREVWGYRGGVRTRTLDTTIRRLRAKIEPDPAKPVRIRTVVGAGYRFDPPLPSVRPHPEIAGFFVGREREVQAVREALEASRLVSVIGPAGIGKTRVAAQAAPMQAYFFDAAGVPVGGGLIQALCAELGLPENADATTVGRAVAGRGCELLVVDTLEHLLPDAAADVVALLQRAWPLKALVTSRRRLGVPVEHVIELGPLDADDAMSLFRHAARRAGAGEIGAAAALTLVDAAERNPLAVEILAGRAALMDAEELGGEAPVGHNLLGSENRARHGSLRAAIQWSWRLLDQRARADLRTLCLFPQAMRAADAHEALGADGPDRLRTLREHSLLSRDPGGWRIPDTVRAFTEEAQPADPAANARVVSWATRRIETLSPPGLWEREAVESLRRLTPSLLAAARLAVDIDPLSAVEILRGLERAFEAPGPRNPWRALVRDLALAEVAGARRLYARALFSAGELDAALIESTAAPDPVLTVRILIGLGRAAEARAALDAIGENEPAAQQLAARMALEGGDIERARAGATAALERYRAAGADQRLIIKSLQLLARVERSDGDLEGCVVKYLEVAELARVSGDRFHEAQAASNAALGHIDLGRYDDAERMIRVSMRLTREMGKAHAEPAAYDALGIVHRERGEHGEAREAFETGLEVARHVGWAPSEGILAGDIALLDHLEGHLDEASARLAEAVDLLERAGFRVAEGMLRARHAAVLADRSDIDAAVDQLAKARAVLGDDVGGLAPFAAAHIALARRRVHPKAPLPEVPPQPVPTSADLRLAERLLVRVMEQRA